MGKLKTKEREKTVCGPFANVANIANAILQSIRFDRAMHIVDFGSGTGLLLERLAPHVEKITAVDVSRAMNEQLRQKRDKLGGGLEIAEADLEKSEIGGRFDWGRFLNDHAPH